MAFIGGNTSGFFGGTSLPQTRIVGINTNLLSLSFEAKLTQIGLQSLSAADRANINAQARGQSDTVTTPWALDAAADSDDSLASKVREVTSLSKLIDLDDRALDAVSGDMDAQATFALYRALNHMKTLAEYSADDGTISSSRGRIDAKFQDGLSEISDYLATADLEKLDLFLGDKNYSTETTTRLGKDSTTYTGTGVTSDTSAVIAGLTGSESFDITLTKTSLTTDEVLSTDTINIDLSGVTGDLSMDNITAYVNEQISAIQATDEGGDPEFDDEGAPIPRYQSQFTMQRNSVTGQYAFKLEGTLTESMSLSATATEPSLYIAASVNTFDSEYADTSRIIEFDGLSGTITRSDTTSFAAIDLQATDINELTQDIEEEDLDANLAALRDKMLADALADVSGDDDTTANDDSDDDNISSLTNIDDDIKVNADTNVSRIAVDSEGSVYTVGQSSGSFGHQINVAETQDVFLTKFDSEGAVVYSRLLGAEGEATAYAIAVDSQDNIIIAGQSDNALHDGDVITGTDAFVVKYSKEGSEQFRYQLDTSSETAGLSLAVDGNDDIIVGGYTSGGISSTSSFGGGTDSMVLKISGNDGSLMSSALIGAATDESVKAVAIANDGNILIAAEEDGHAVLRKLDATDLSTEIFSIDLGALGTGGSIAGIVVDGSDIYVAGTTLDGDLDASDSATVNGSLAGGFDGFLTKFTDNTSTVSADYTTYLGTSGVDRINDLTVNNGSVYLAGVTNDTLSGEDAKGSVDGFVMRVAGATGAIEDSEQFGEGLSKHDVAGVAFTDQGSSVLSTLGLPRGTLGAAEAYDIQTQTSAKVGDHFYMSIDGGRKKEITLEDGDTFDDIARKIRVAAFSKLDVTVSSTTEGDKIKFALDDQDNSIDFIPGAEGQDLLTRIGLNDLKLLPKDYVLGLLDDIPPEEDLGGAFGLKLEGALHLNDAKTAKYVLGLLDNAISTVQRAYRSLTYDPIKQSLLDGASQTGGTVSTRVQNQIAGYTLALQRLSAGPPSTGGFF